MRTNGKKASPPVFLIVMLFLFGGTWLALEHRDRQAASARALA